jgi:GrpB-like predicted nucleotidyltransferase (UPF0157 family)
MTEPIVIEEYNLLWPGMFETLRTQIMSALDGLAAAVEHVGSTAVPELAAKPIIDLDVLLVSAADLPLAILKLAALGYEHRGDLDVFGREAFRAPPGSFPHHLYVCLPDSQEFRRHILFRDYLRSHARDARAYSVLKRELAARFSADREAYTEGKGAFVEEILRRAVRNRSE